MNKVAGIYSILYPKQQHNVRGYTIFGVEITNQDTLDTLARSVGLNWNWEFRLRSARVYGKVKAGEAGEFNEIAPLQRKDAIMRSTVWKI